MDVEKFHLLAGRVRSAQERIKNVRAEIKRSHTELDHANEAASKASAELHAYVNEAGGLSDS
jgi:hypothetical protein